VVEIKYRHPFVGRVLFKGLTACNLFYAVWKFGVCLASPRSADHPRRVGYLLTLSAIQTAGCSLNDDLKTSCHGEICSDLSGVVEGGRPLGRDGKHCLRGHKQRVTPWGTTFGLWICGDSKPSGVYRHTSNVSKTSCQQKVTLPPGTIGRL